MAQEEDSGEVFRQEDHQVAYLFDPDSEELPGASAPKRRKVSTRKSRQSELQGPSSDFVPLFNGAESPACLQLREKLFTDGWGVVEGRIQDILRNSNSATLDQVSSFAKQSASACDDKIPSAFIITGPNIASQDLLFEQLSETLQSSFPSRFVRLRSTDGKTLKGALKKIIRDVTASTGNDDDLQVGEGRDGRRYLDYDLEALYAHTRANRCEHVFVAFQDSEAFDSSLLSDLIPLFNSWRPRIPFTLVFGIATSIEHLQARLLKSVCQQIYGAQFDVVQSETILEAVFKQAVAACDVPLRLGPGLLHAMLDRQLDQMAGIQAFISSLKYAYMCHYYANPLSILCSSEGMAGDVLQDEHVRAVRNLPSFRQYVEDAIERGGEDNLTDAKGLVEDDGYVRSNIRHLSKAKENWITNSLRSLLIVEAMRSQPASFSRSYVDGMSQGLTLSDKSEIVEVVRRMNVDEFKAMLQRIIAVFRMGDSNLHLRPQDSEEYDSCQPLEGELVELQQLQMLAEEKGITLRSKYGGQKKVMRTTVVAQKVQLSQNSAALRDEDKQFTGIIDNVLKFLTSHIDVGRAEDVFLSEAWLYDFKSPSREVFVPRPRLVFERSLTRPHDYLNCDCCGEGEGIKATLPATSILYHLYLETGTLINVADLWSAFSGLVTEDVGDEREALLLFYRGLAELRSLGFVKPSKKKVDHVAKLKWL